jgi:Flp pilus assembly protein TadG
MKTFGRKFANDRRGTAAVEMAFIAPVVAVLAISAYSVWEAASRGQDMRVALKTGAEYYMNGGTSDSTAQSVTLSAWQNPPSGATVTISRSCYCIATPQDCSTACATGITRSLYATITAKATQSSAALDQTLTELRVIRVS